MTKTLLNDLNANESQSFSSAWVLDGCCWAIRPTTNTDNSNLFIYLFTPHDMSALISASRVIYSRVR